MPYQSFLGDDGDSKSYEKLQALRLPDLAGKSFLDMGCNEGFFCGYALFDGAMHVVGQDQSEVAIAQARKTFPDANFLVGSWEESLPRGPFDVILLASSLHYARDPEALIESLMMLLTPQGLLVLEVGIDRTRDGDGWFGYQRSKDLVRHAESRTLQALAARKRWFYRVVGPSVSQSGDGVSREVIHMSRDAKRAWVVMGPPDAGKTTIGTEFALQLDGVVISGDRTWLQLASGELVAPETLVNIARHAAESLDWSLAYERISGNSTLIGAFVRSALEDVPSSSNVILEGSLTWEDRHHVSSSLIDLGYAPIFTVMDHPIMLNPKPADLEKFRDFVVQRLK